MEKGLERLQSFMNDTTRWSDETFDNGKFNRGRSIPISHHLKKEVKELTESLESYFQNGSVESFEKAKYELADCMILICDCATHFGCNADELLTACENKLEINKARKWGFPDENGVVEHIK